MESIAGNVRGGRLALVVLVVASALFLFAPPAQAAQQRGSYEACLFDSINASRASAGAAPLLISPDLAGGVRNHSKWMREHDFEHMSTSARNAILPSGTFTWAENVAWTSNENAPCSTVHKMLMNSPGHRANILNRSMRYVAIGAHIDGSGTYVTELFFDAKGYQPHWNGRFWDDDDSVFESAIASLANSGITNGCNPPGNDRFCPDDYVTRGMMAAFLVRAFELPATSGIEFSDDNGSVFETAIEKLAGAGITEGCNPPANTKFCPDVYVTRGMMAAFLVRGLGLSAAESDPFTDDDGTIFEGAIERLAAAGITQGCNPPANTKFCPDQYVTRGMMAAFLMRALGQ